MASNGPLTAKTGLLLCLSAVMLLHLSSVGGELGADIAELSSGNEWLVAASSNRKMLVIFYKTSGCAGCQEMVEAVGEIAGTPDLDDDLQVVKSTDTTLASGLGVTGYPAVVYLRENSHVIYDGKAEADHLLEWLELSRSKVTKWLHEDSFEHLTQASTGATTGDWLVAFYKESCSSILPIMESVGVRIRQKTNVAVVDASKNTLLVDRFKVQKCPEIMLFKQGKMYRYDVPKVDRPSLRSFVDSWYRNAKAEIVLPPKSKFDFLTEAIASYIKDQMEGENRNLVLASLAGGAVTVLMVLVCCCRSVASTNQKVKAE